jgi:hypothetical protein
MLAAKILGKEESFVSAAAFTTLANGVFIRSQGILGGENQLKKIFIFLAENRLAPVLEKMAATSVPAVITCSGRMFRRRKITTFGKSAPPAARRSASQGRIIRIF